ncbi:MAG: hypothetical protein V8R49_10375 [Duodenibacillus massiliensis]
MSESPLISVKELEAELSDDNLLILDVRASLTDRLRAAGSTTQATFPARALPTWKTMSLAAARAPTAGIRCRIPGASASICGVSA